MLTKYGIDNIVIMLFAGVLFLALGYYIDKFTVSLFMYLPGIVLIVMVFIFFRDPERNIPEKVKNDDSFVLSPADGKIVEIIETVENDYLKEKCKRLSIFLSPLDVHVNRVPVTGIVEYYNYRKGKYLLAYHPKSSEFNEQSKIGVKTKYGRVLFKQIVGTLARRLVCELKIGDEIEAGNRFGMMKFGSRMDLFVPLDCQLYVNINDRVSAGETILGKLKIRNK